MPICKSETTSLSFMRWDLIRQAHYVLVSARSEFESKGDGAIFEVLDLIVMQN